MNKRIRLNHSVLDFMADVLKQQAEPLVLEFGSGWSSAWFAARCGWLVTVETDPRWSTLVENDLTESGFSNWEMYIGELPSDTLFLDGAQADLVLVDCREDLRFAAAKLGWTLLKSGGWLIFDDAHRQEYTAPLEYLRNFGTPVTLKWNKEYDVGRKEKIALAWQKQST